MRFRIIAAAVAFIVAALFFRQSVWYHHNLDALIRIPYVFGAAIIGMLVAGLGIRLLLPR